MQTLKWPREKENDKKADEAYRSANKKLEILMKIRTDCYLLSLLCGFAEFVQNIKNIESFRGKVHDSEPKPCQTIIIWGLLIIYLVELAFYDNIFIFSHTLLLIFLAQFQIPPLKLFGFRCNNMQIFNILILVNTDLDEVYYLIFAVVYQ